MNAALHAFRPEVGARKIVSQSISWVYEGGGTPADESVALDGTPERSGMIAAWERGAGNRKARIELGWTPAWPTWRTGFVASWQRLSVLADLLVLVDVTDVPLLGAQPLHVGISGLLAQPAVRRDDTAQCAIDVLGHA